MQPVPAHLAGQYDIVHIGRIFRYIQHENPSRLLENFTSLLKPGGYLCWDELDLGSEHPQSSDPNVSHIHADRIEDGAYRPYGWVGELDSIFRSYGLE
ncbi:hypothetical protein BU26DRAFT_560894 [Trematosphaeria pertusa]|uniref:Class I SAM-dependent methyltransferase n=1 Tax=Trematosphaeria pertusa TaxID=390896 RepID=A0A6A6IU14_9PLEO|nr:uncharacterized protein BU26DRAFT_560894 [Trematosphaeria pertusa]KAF2253607.1 hypothetical protein BU26DRAFT_560894 [Trematosphaeria pertusa]